jgi:tRNA(Ile)-lysidine synthase
VSRPRAPLAERVAARLFAHGRARPGDRALVAVSGGLDSVVLLHLLRFAPEIPRLELVAAHFDHRMRPESADDARWVGELAREWGIPFETDAAASPPRTEAEARRARYDWLAEVKARVGARWILTAHHADDQAETVLFRIARGAGTGGLRGIPLRRGALIRALLSAWREEIESYAAAHELAHRVDASNAELRFARNLLRHQVIPGLAQAAPGARRALVRLARVAAREESAWRVLLSEVVDQVLVERTPERVTLARGALLGWPEAVQARLLRRFARELGGVLGEAGTRSLIEFTREGASGRSHQLAGGLVLAREFDRIVLTRPGAPPDESPLEIRAVGRGEGIARIGGRRWSARWSPADLPPDVEEPTRLERASFAVAKLVFPLRVRGWRPGDRIRLPYGSKKLKKLLGESRIPVSDRGRVPVLADAADRVLWVPGVGREAGIEPAPGEEFLQIGVRDADGA